MPSHTLSANRAAPRDRSAFWVAPPRRHVVNRTARAAVPRHLSVVVAADPARVTPSAFLRPVAPPPPDAAAAAAAAAGLFPVPVYVWEDTTLREILETVLASSPAARAALLPADLSEEKGEGEGEEVGKGEENVEEHQQAHGNSDGMGESHLGKETAKHHADDAGRNSCGDGEDNEDAEDEQNGKEGGDNEPLLKRERTEKEETENPKDERDVGEATRKRARRKRRPAMPAAEVTVSQVIPESNGKPHIDSLCVMRVDRPIFRSGDVTTIREMRNYRGSRMFKNGNLIVIAPTVCHYKSSSLN